MSKVSEVYARALLKYGGEENCGLFIQQLKAFCSVIDAYPEVFRWFQFRYISRYKKMELADNIGKNLKLDKRVMNFIRLLVLKNRFNFIKEIIVELENIYSREKVLNIKLESPVELDEKLIQEISSIIKNKLQRDLQLFPVVNSEMLFGFRIYFDHKLYDLSLKGIFRHLRDRWRNVHV